MTEGPTHESDKELWLAAHHRAPAFTLQPGQTLSPAERAWAQDEVSAIAEMNEREREEDR